MKTEVVGSHRNRRNVTYRNLKKSTTQMMLNIKKRMSHAEQSLRNRRTPLNESRSSTPVGKQMRIVIPQLPHTKDLYSTTARNIDLEGYIFDSESNILQTPEHIQTPNIHRRKIGKTARLRGFTLRNAFKNPAQSECCSMEGRLAKQNAVVNIHGIQSPKFPFLASATYDLNARSSALICKNEFKSGGIGPGMMRSAMTELDFNR